MERFQQAESRGQLRARVFTAREVEVGLASVSGSGITGHLLQQ